MTEKQPTLNSYLEKKDEQQQQFAEKDGFTIENKIVAVQGAEGSKDVRVQTSVSVEGKIYFLYKLVVTLVDGTQKDLYRFSPEMAKKEPRFEPVHVPDDKFVRLSKRTKVPGLVKTNISDEV